MINKLVMLSGGIDSAVLVAFLLHKQQHDPERVGGVFMNYGQPAFRQEETAAGNVADHFGIKLTVLDLTQIFFNNRFWTDINNSEKGSVHQNYFPARNLMLTSVAVAYLASLEGGVVYSGANQTDAHNGFPDCRADFWHSLDKVCQIGVRPRVEVRAPFCSWSKLEVVKEGQRFQVPFEQTYSCYAGFNRPCNECDACRLRNNLFQEVGYVPNL